jgi:hypothetical protein
VEAVAMIEAAAREKSLVFALFAEFNVIVAMIND